MSHSSVISKAATRPVFAGLFLITMGTLIYEVLLTRIFSVTMWYHFAFVAVSVALFGMTVGANVVYLRPQWFPQDRLLEVLRFHSLCFAVSTPLSFLTHLSIPFHVEMNLTSFYSIVLNYAVISVPFVFSGIVVALVLTRYPRQVSTLYMADLAGAAVGALIFIRLLQVVDGPNAVLVVGFIVAVGAWAFGRGAGGRQRAAVLVLLGIGGFTAFSIVMSYANHPPLRLIWAKDAIEYRHAIERWNAFSRITVDPMGTEPFGWGLSPANPVKDPVDQVYLTIDSTAGTPITRFDGKDTAKVGYLRYDIVNLCHYLRPDSDVAVLGLGGGRDLLSALVFQQRSILGLEINDNIVKVLNQDLRNYAGHLDRLPNVRMVNDEARSYLARSQKRYGVIQVSLIDTWAATSAGAFVLTENSLYTVEAWKLFLKRLTPDGVLTFSRWYFPDRPAEAYRLMGLAVQSLREIGIAEPAKHIIFAKVSRKRENGPDGVGTILISPKPFTAADLANVQSISQQLKFDLLFTPAQSQDPLFTRMVSGEDIRAISDSYPLRIDPPTDNSPFFFQMMRLRDIFRVGSSQGYMTSNLRAVSVLGVLLCTVVLLTGIFVVAPLVVSAQIQALTRAWPILVYFAAIGLGFMFIEISQMQRLIVFLGHPIYGLGVVLFSLLVSSGLGSGLAGRWVGSARANAIALVALVAVLLGMGPLTGIIISSLEGAETTLRIVGAVGLLFPMGLVMGAAFPIGIGIAAKRAPAMMPWFWGINGATSVCGSVLAACVALASSISVSYWCGAICYAGALGALLLAQSSSSASRANVAKA